MRYRNVALYVDKVHSGGYAVSVPKYDPVKIFTLTEQEFPIEHRRSLHPGFCIHVDVVIKKGDNLIIEKWYLM